MLLPCFPVTPLTVAGGTEEDTCPLWWSRATIKLLIKGPPTLARERWPLIKIHCKAVSTFVVAVNVNIVIFLSCYRQLERSRRSAIVVAVILGSISFSLLLFSAVAVVLAHASFLLVAVVASINEVI